MSVSTLSQFLEPVRCWFADTLGNPTRPQALGWPHIAAGRHTLILAPTGSGKTLAAFLACLDDLWRQPHLPPGVQVLYISPLKALNNDIERNLRVPLAGVADYARRLGAALPEIRVAVRTGDTPPAERQRLVKNPAQVLITTPESLHLLLTSNQRTILRGVRYCIVDEIHVLCPNKRGVFLSLLLERLSALTGTDFVRVGLSATQRPLEEVARYLGGTERQVEIVDAGLRKDLDLKVVSPVDQFGWQPERSIWPSIHRLLVDELRQHRSTLIFASSRRQVERLANDINDVLAEEPAADPNALEAAPTAPPPLAVRPHHGSLSLEVRHATEQALKAGQLAGVVATASLELGIDMGSVELVAQVESPGNVARGLQRVGRAGHLVGQRSKGRLIPKTPADLLDLAVLAREMLAGRVERLRVPTNCLDVLAQQIVAMVAVESWDVPALFQLLRRSYPYRDLTPEALDGVLEMLSGRFPAEAFRDLRARIGWDRIHNRLHALPGSKGLALAGGGTIPDTGQYAAYILGTELRIGELDEEFVYERRIGDVFQLGVHSWRIEQIEADRVLVSQADGAPALMPFWRGESLSRSTDFGLALGGFLREASARMGKESPADFENWLAAECHLDERATRNLRRYLKAQVEAAGCIPTDQTLLVEAFRDQLGDWHVAILSPLGARFHFTLRLALEARWRQRFGYQPQCVHADDGLLIKLVDVDEPPLDLLQDLDAATLEQLVLGELADSALFAIRFRHNAARTLMMPRAQPGKRAPLWLQRLRARSLLQVCRQYPNFPVVVETFRECLRDHLEVPRLKEWLAALHAGTVKIVTRRGETPSPFAAGLLFQFTAQYMYVYDRVDPAKAPPALDKELLDQLLEPSSSGNAIDGRVVAQVEQRLRGRARPRSKEEAAEWLRRLGDVRAAEVEPGTAAYLDELAAEGRAVRWHLPGGTAADLWLLAEELPTYLAAFRPAEATIDVNASAAGEAILRRYLLTRVLVGLDDVLARYPFDRAWAAEVLNRWAREGAAVRLESGAEPLQWSAPANWAEVRRTALAISRREVPTVSPARFQDFVLRWQHVHPASRGAGPEGLRAALERLTALPLPARLWEQAVLPTRVKDYQPRWLDEFTLNGEWCWALVAAGEVAEGDLAFIPRAELPFFPRPEERSPDDGLAQVLLDTFERGTAAFTVDLAQRYGKSPAEVRRAIWQLAKLGLISNDRFDLIRRGEEREPATAETPRSGRRRLLEMRRVRSQRPEGRWSLLPWGTPEAEERALHAAEILLQRYGVVSRELAQMDPWLPPWRLMYEVLSRMELAGEVRRGFFVEGLSGAQFALPEAVRLLAEPPSATDEASLLHSRDPAALLVRGGPLERAAWEQTDADDAPVSRRANNWLVLCGGRPVLLIEQQGRRLTPGPGATPADLAAAVGQLQALLRTGLGVHLRGKVVVESWQDRPVIGSPGQPLLEAAGFVRDYQALALYASYPA